MLYAILLADSDICRLKSQSKQWWPLQFLVRENPGRFSIRITKSSISFLSILNAGNLKWKTFYIKWLATRTSFINPEHHGLSVKSVDEPLI